MTSKSLTKYNLITGTAPTVHADFDIAWGASIGSGFGYDVTLTVSDEWGNSDNITKHVTVTSTGLIIFKDMSTGLIKYWHWDFGDQHLSQIASPVHLYIAPVPPTGPLPTYSLGGSMIPSVVFPGTDEVVFIALCDDHDTGGSLLWGRKGVNWWNGVDIFDWHYGPSSLRREYMFRMSSGTIVWFDDDANSTWQSYDGGFTWLAASTDITNDGRQRGTMAKLPDDSLVLVGGQTDPYEEITGHKNDTWKSIDEGKTWTQTSTSASWAGRHYHNLVAATSTTHPNGYLLLMGGLVGLYGFFNDVWISYDKGVTWSWLFGTTIYQLDGMVGAPPDRQEDETWYTWPGQYAYFTDIDSTLVFLPFEGYPLYKSKDEGKTWSIQSYTPADGLTRKFCGMIYIPPVSVDAPLGRLLIFGGFWTTGTEGYPDFEVHLRGDTWESDDYGVTWVKTNDYFA